MSLITATPSVGRRAGSTTHRSRERQAGQPRLSVVRDDHRPSAPARTPVRSQPGPQPRTPARTQARPEPSYRSQLSVRSARPVAQPIRTAQPTRTTLPARTTPAARAAAPVRLTRRGRIVVRIGTVGLVLLALVGGVLLLNRTAEAGSTSRPVPVSYRVVVPGETLWQIAGEVAPGVDRRDTVARILELNALSSAGVTAGQRIAVPVRTP